VELVGTEEEVGREELEKLVELGVEAEEVEAGTGELGGDRRRWGRRNGRNWWNWE
jgi:hypothetical protein